jgi:hypothetical protein
MRFQNTSFLQPLPEDDVPKGMRYYRSFFPPLWIKALKGRARNVYLKKQKAMG